MIAVIRRVYRIACVATGYTIGEHRKLRQNSERQNDTAYREVDHIIFVDVFIARNVETEKLQRYCVYLHVFVPWIKSYPTYLVGIKFIHWISAG